MVWYRTRPTPLNFIPIRFETTEPRLSEERPPPRTTRTRTSRVAIGDQFLIHNHKPEAVIWLLVVVKHRRRKMFPDDIIIRYKRTS